MFGIVLLVGLLVALPARAVEPAWEALPDRVDASAVAVVVGEDGDGVWFLSGEVTRRLGQPVQGLLLERITAEGVREHIAAGIGLIGGDLSSRGELALVTLEGDVLVGTHEADLRPLDLGDLFVTQARWDPSGERLAVTAWSGGSCPWDTYSARTVDELLRAIDSDVYLVDGAGNTQRLTVGPKQDYNPVWSPDGTQLLFISLRTGYASLFLADMTRGGVSQLTNFGAERGAPAQPVPLSDHGWWTASGVVFETVGASGSEVWVMSPTGRFDRIAGGSALGLVGEDVGLLRTTEGWRTFDLEDVTEGGLP